MKKNRLKAATTAAFFLILLCFLFFVAYMWFFENNTVHNPRDFDTTSTVQDVTERVISDSSAPAGIRREFTWTMPDCDGNESCLIFYLVHHYADVFFGDELVYSLSPGEDNRIGNSPSSNWIIIPIRPSDNGKTVTVTATPAYSSVADREISFEVGSRHTIIMYHLQADLPQILLAVLCVLIGLILIATHCYLLLQKKVPTSDLFYLGIFSLLVGIWRITDTRYSSLLFPNNPMVLGYITLGALMLCSIPLLLYVKNSYPDSERLLLLTALMNCAVAIIALLCQVCDVADFREMLVINHGMLVLNLSVVLCVSVLNASRGKDPDGTWKLILLVSVGCVIDLFRYYNKGSSASIFFTIFGFLVFSTYRLVSGILNARQKAYTDAKTGLFNRNRWDELMKLSAYTLDSIGVMMLDLNRLKYVNDTLGHEAGDKMIFNFANILRNTIPPSNTICRWGGDEFTVMVTDATQEKMEGYIQAIADAAAQYNASGELPEIHYAAGWVLSSEFPELRLNELLDKADQRMYLDKQRWYAGNKTAD